MLCLRRRTNNWKDVHHAISTSRLRKLPTGEQRRVLRSQ